MNTYTNKTKKEKATGPAANAIAEIKNSKHQVFLTDNRSTTAAQREINKRADKNSAQEVQPIQKKENKTGLPDQLKSGMENLSGMAMDDVKVHYNSSKPAQFNALAYAQGANIHLAPQQEKHLPHEAWHVVQQKQGRVKPTLQVNGSAVNDNKGLEKEADTMSGKAMQQKSTGVVQSKLISTPGSSTIQRYLTIGNDPKNMVQYTDYASLPHEAKQTVQQLKGSNPAYRDIEDWIGEWYIFLRMNDDKDLAGLKKYVDRMLVHNRTMLVKNPADRVYGYGRGPALPNTGAAGPQGQIGRERNAPIQDTLNNRIVGLAGAPDLTSEAAEFADMVQASKYAPAAARAAGKQWNIKGAADFKKLCKAGLVFHTKSRAAPVTIHFDISGMDMHDVVKKHGRTGSMITSAELRSIYRQYLVQLKGYAPDIDLTRVKFYFMGTEVPPPWIEDPSLWASYQPKFHDKPDMHNQSWSPWKVVGGILLLAAAAGGAYLLYKKNPMALLGSKK